MGDGVLHRPDATDYSSRIQVDNDTLEVDLSGTRRIKSGGRKARDIIDRSGWFPGGDDPAAIAHLLLLRVCLL